MSYDQHLNFSYSLIATAPSPATSGTSLTVQSGEGARFPAAPFNAVVWPASQNALPSNAEVVRVTAKSTDTFTITRTQESSNARSIQVGDQIALNVTAKWFTDLENNKVEKTGDTMTGQLNITNTGIGATPVDTNGAVLVNTTAAAAGAQQYSPEVRWRGQGWKTNATAASQSVDFRAYVVPVQGAANPTGKLTIESSVNGGAYGGALSIDTSGLMSLPTPLPVASGGTGNSAAVGSGKVIYGSTGGIYTTDINLNYIPTLQVMQIGTLQFGKHNLTLEDGVFEDSSGNLYVSITSTDPGIIYFQQIGAGNFQWRNRDSGDTTWTDLMSLDTNESNIKVGQKVKRTTVANVNYTALLTDYIIAYTSLSTGRTVALPPAATAGNGKLLIIKDEAGSAGTNNITADPNGAELIDGAATKAISTNYGVLRIYCNGTSWFSW